MSKATTSQPRKRNNSDNQGREASASKPYIPTDQERVLVKNFFEERKNETPSPKMKAEKENDGKIAICDRRQASLTAAVTTRRRLLDALLGDALAPTDDRELEAVE